MLFSLEFWSTAATTKNNNDKTINKNNNSLLKTSSQHAHLGPLQVFSSSDLSLNQMVTVDGGGDGDPGQAAADELQHGHLSSGVLHGHPVGTQAQVRAAAVNLLANGVV